MADLRNTRLSVAARNAATDAVTALANGGRIRIYTGAQPAAGGAASGTMLWESPALPTPAFDPAVNGVGALVAAQSGPIVATGTAGWFRVTDISDQVVWDGSIGEIGDGDQNNLELDEVELVSGGTCTLDSLTFDAKAQGQ
jgi:hypothetical protein